MENLLYKYRSIDKNGLDILINSALFFPTTNTFNDPFDGQLLPSNFESELKELGLQSGIQSKSICDSHIKDVLNRSGVLSLCKSADHILMWSHYAESHKGLCLGFKPDLRHHIKIDEAPVRQYPVIYEEDHPFKKIFESCPKIDSFSDFADLNYALKIAALTIKHRHWEYEAEERLISEKAGLYLFNPEALDCVILGMNTSEKDVFTIKNLINRDEWRHVRLLRAYRGKAALKLDIQEVPKNYPC